jgi:hypothetical protein
MDSNSVTVVFTRSVIDTCARSKYQIRTLTLTLTSLVLYFSGEGRSPTCWVGPEGKPRQYSQQHHRQREADHDAVGVSRYHNLHDAIGSCS